MIRDEEDRGAPAGTVPRLDRRAELRGRLGGQEADLPAGAALLLSWRRRVFVRGEPPEPAILPSSASPLALEAADRRIYLGELGGVPLFGLDLSSSPEPLETLDLEGKGVFRDLLAVGGGMSSADRDLLAYLRALLGWHREALHCGRCGAETFARSAGHIRRCERCERDEFPRTDAAVMVLLHHEDRILLARQPSFPPGMLSVLAGFVEPGESLEQCVIREVQEEVGLELDSLRYRASQPWPFPRSLMIAFSARALSAEFRLDREELEEARWLSRAELAAPEGLWLPPRISLARRLIDAFLEDPAYARG
ncbi:MAG: NAD(+) diphosphatase [Myxococcales bacterium]|nr:NAD(+) diphosphatase [Myxococcales bacterium]